MAWLAGLKVWLAGNENWLACSEAWLNLKEGQTSRGGINGWRDIWTEMEPVAQRHQMVSNSLALPLLIGLDLPLGSRAAAPIGEKIL